MGGNLDTALLCPRDGVLGKSHALDWLLTLRQLLLKQSAKVPSLSLPGSGLGGGGTLYPSRYALDHLMSPHFPTAF